MSIRYLSHTVRLASGQVSGENPKVGSSQLDAKLSVYIEELSVV